MTKANVKILVVGDSYANNDRFKRGIEEEYLGVGCKVSVISISFPGRHCADILKNLRMKSYREYLSDIGPFSNALIVGGVNDVIQRRGARRYQESARALTKELERYAGRVYVMELVAFDENSHCSRLPGLIKNRLLGLLRDRGVGRIERYREAAAIFGADGRLVDTRSFLASYNAAWFKDGVHLTPERFDALAHHVGRQLAAAHAANP